MWAWLGDYESKFCERLIHPLYALLIPFVSHFSVILFFIAQLRYLATYSTRSARLTSDLAQIWLIIWHISAVILIRAYAFTGRKMSVGIIFGIGFLALLGAEIWLFGTQFPCIIFSNLCQNLLALIRALQMFTY
jgi:hypothetical protein